MFIVICGNKKIKIRMKFEKRLFEDSELKTYGGSEKCLTRSGAVVGEVVSRIFTTNYMNNLY